MKAPNETSLFIENNMDGFLGEMKQWHRGDMGLTLTGLGYIRITRSIKEPWDTFWRTRSHSILEENKRRQQRVYRLFCEIKYEYYSNHVVYLVYFINILIGIQNIFVVMSARISRHQQRANTQKSELYMYILVFASNEFSSEIYISQKRV